MPSNIFKFIPFSTIKQPKPQKHSACLSKQNIFVLSKNIQEANNNINDVYGIKLTSFFIKIAVTVQNHLSKDDICIAI